MKSLRARHLYLSCLAAAALTGAHAEAAPGGPALNKQGNAGNSRCVPDSDHN